MSAASSSFPALANPFAPTAFERAKEKRSNAARWILGFMTIALVIPVLLIMADIFIKAWPALSFDFVWENPTDKGKAGGIWAPLIGTFYLVLVSLLITAPIGILAGIYLHEYAPDNWATRIVSMAVTTLAGVPSIVHALFGVGAFVLFFNMGVSLLAASCTIAVMTMPVIITATREALGAVPKSFREACWNLGASRWQTVRTIVLPNSVSGILTGVILEVARAAGETAPILFTGAVFFVPMSEGFGARFAPYYLGDQFMALSMHLHVIATQISGMPPSIPFATAAVLISLILLLNAVSIFLRIRLRKKW